jgi:hypothetical protein
MMDDKDATAPQPQRVERTGIALVHEGERIYPAEGAIAPLGPLSAASVSYYFPVEIEVVGGGMDTISEQIFDALRLHIEALV